MLSCKSVTLHVWTPDLAEKLPGRECFAPFKEANPQHPPSGQRGEVQWLFGSPRTFEISSEMQFFGILDIPKLPPKLLSATLRKHAGARDLKTNETRGDRFEHGDFEYRIGGLRFVHFRPERQRKPSTNHVFSTKILIFDTPKR